MPKIQVYRTRLKAGIHHGTDYDADPLPGGQYPSREFRAGEVFYSKDDLSRSDPARYEAVGDRPKTDAVTIDVPGPSRNEGHALAAFPNGQLPEGVQQTVMTEYGPRSGPLQKETLDPNYKPPGVDVVGGGPAVKDVGTDDPAGDDTAKKSPDELTQMSMGDLKKYAADRKIDLAGATTKDKMIDVISKSGK